jgi:hypothetical protein
MKSSQPIAYGREPIWRLLIMKKSFAYFLSVLLIVLMMNGSGFARPHVTMRVNTSGSVPNLKCSLVNESSPHIAIDPKNPKHLAIVYSLGNSRFEDATPDPVNPVQGYQHEAAIVASSYDGGETWSRVALSGITLCDGGENGVIGDPFIAIGEGGHVAVTEGWVSWDPFPSTEHSDARLFVSTSSDLGATFSSPVEPERTMDPDARQRGPVLFDPQSPDSLFVAFERFHYVNCPVPNPTGGYIFGIGSSVAVAKSEDGGATFSTVATPIMTSSGQEVLTVSLLKSGTDLVLLAAIIDDGDFVAALGSFIGPLSSTLQPAANQLSTPLQLVSVRSTDGGATFGPPTKIGAGYFGIPQAAAGPNGSLYVTWTDAARNGVFLARSNDGGETWTGGDQPAFTPANGAMESAVAVRPDGTVGIFYYAFTPDATQPGDVIVTPYVSVSNDGISDWKTIPIASPFDLSKMTGGNGDGPVTGPYQDIIPFQDGFGSVVTLGDGQGEEHVWFIKVNF